MAGKLDSSPPDRPWLMASAALLKGAFSPWKMPVSWVPRFLACVQTSPKPEVRPLQIWAPMSMPFCTRAV